MTRQNYQLGNTVSKITEAMILWQTERGIIEVSKNTLSIALKLGDQQKGYILHGQGKLLLDTIVETDRGAVGKSVEKELDEPFIMLGDTKEIHKHLNTASEEDCAKMGYESQQGFAAKAEDLCSRFFRGRAHSHEGFDEDHSLIFAFPNGESKSDILVAKGSKLVYKATGIVFVSKGNKTVLKSPGEVVCMGNGKSVHSKEIVSFSPSIFWLFKRTHVHEPS